MNRDTASDRAANLLDERRKIISATPSNKEAASLKKQLFSYLSEPGMKTFLARLIEDPEDHEELMRELLQGREISSPEPYEVFRNTVLIAIDVLTASIAGAMREKDVNTAVLLTEKAVKLSLKIKDWDTGEKCWLQLEAMAGEVGLTTPELRQMFILRITDLLEEQEKTDEAVKCLSTLIALIENNNDTATILNLQMRIAELYRKSRKLEEAEELFKSSIDTALDKLNDTSLSACGWLGLARIQNAGTDTEEAARFYRNALEDAASSNETEITLTAGYELGLLYAQIEENEKSWECLNKALNIAISAKDVNAQVKLVQTLWLPCENLKKWGDYLVSLRTVRYFIQAENFNMMLGPVLICFARVQTALGNSSEARRHLDEAHELYTQLEDPEGIMEVEELMTSIENSN